MRIRILHPGLQATIQDLGRPQWRASGVPSGGAADVFSHRIANLLLSNAPEAATIELVGGGSRIEVLQAGWLAWAGPGATCHIDGLPSEGARLAYLPSGTVLQFRISGQGNYSYLACAGGWDVPMVLDSRSNCLSARFGGLHGRPLQRDDMLSALAALASPQATRHISSCFVAQPPSPWLLTLRTLPGPERNLWAPRQQTAWADATFLLTPQHDRMGARLQPASDVDLRIQAAAAARLPSSAVQPGTVQLPPDGCPIVLLADAQTTGGYPRMAQVVAADLPLLAQCRAGQMLRFQDVAMEEAERLWQCRQREWQCLGWAMRYTADR